MAHRLMLVFTSGADRIGGVNKGAAIVAPPKGPAIAGRIEEVSQAQLDELDSAEGFRRRVVTTTRGPAWMYEVDDGDSKDNG